MKYVFAGNGTVTCIVLLDQARDVAGGHESLFEVIVARVQELVVLSALIGGAHLGRHNVGAGPLHELEVRFALDVVDGCLTAQPLPELPFGVTHGFLSVGTETMYSSKNKHKSQRFFSV